MAKNQQKFSFNVEKAQADIDVSDNVAAMQRCVAEIKDTLSITQRLNTQIKLQLTSAVNLEEAVKQIIPELRMATAIRVTTRCREDYNRMCAERLDAFKKELAAAINQAVKYANGKIADAVSDQLARVRKVDSRVSIPWPLAMALCWLSCGGVSLAAYLLRTDFSAITEQGMKTAIFYSVGISFLASLLLSAIWWIYKRFK